LQPDTAGTALAFRREHHAAERHAEAHMPHKTKAEIDRERWTTLPETVAHICWVDKCDEKLACRELVKALVEGLRPLGPLKWERECTDKPAPFGFSPITAPTDTPPVGRAWETAEICWETGRVRDDWGEYKPGRWRVLLILRSNVVRCWPPLGSSADSVGSSSEEAVKTALKAAVKERVAEDGKGGKLSHLARVVGTSQRAVGRSTAREQIHNELRKMQEEGQDLSLPQKKLAELIANRTGHSLGQSNWKLRTIQEHISKWKRDNGLT
jgi:hypothetical protein